MPTTTLKKTYSFNRPSLHPTVPTPLDMFLYAQLAAGTPLYFDDGKLVIYIKADADERDGSVNLGTLVRCELTPVIDASGNFELQTNFIPVLGTGADSVSPAPTPINVPHPENMDTWMSEKGRARQDYFFQQPSIQDDQLLFTGTILLDPFFDFNG